ncbi:MAG: hypothetical protein WB566_10865 [Terriglobales bacterium]
MSRCAVDAVSWNHRRAYRLSNTNIELTALVGGGHIADFRRCGSPINVLWESPWPTIEPQTFSSRQQHAALYGDGPVGRFLCGYTGHALALGCFGMPSSEEAEQGMALHGEAADSEWSVASAVADGDLATLVMEVTLSAYRLHFRREISLSHDAFTACITEIVTNVSGDPVEFQWVEHAAFGEPFFAHDEAALFASGRRGITWPLGYEGHELLASDVEYQWPYAQSIDGEPVNLSQPFVRDGTGFVAALLLDSDHRNAFVAVHNRRLQMVAGYSFNPMLFPWIALWEENRARAYAPWNKRTRVRGVEFGTSPMPLGLAHAREMRRLFDTPVLCSIPANACLQARYDLFLHPVPPQWSQIKNVRQTEHTLVVRGDSDTEITLHRGKRGR